MRKTGGQRERAERNDLARAKPDEKPGAAASRTVMIVADVVEVNPATGFVVLKGPQCNIVKLDVQNPEHFKVVRVGDQVEAVDVEALAIAIRPASGLQTGTLAAGSGAGLARSVGRLLRQPAFAAAPRRRRSDLS